MATMAEVKAANGDWFSRGNKRFFGDIQYWVLQGRSGKPYLLRSTYMWSDMFGQPKRVSYRVTEIEADTLKIGGLIDDIFKTREDAKDWIKEH
jgi:hypothetical protein